MDNRLRRQRRIEASLGTPWSMKTVRDDLCVAVDVSVGGTRR